MEIECGNILVVENELNNVRLFELVFKSTPHKLFFVKTIEEAREKLENYNIKVIITDYVNAGKDVISFFEQLEKVHPCIQKIILTDHMDPVTMSKAINQGRIFHYLYKPIDPESLVVVVNKAISQYDLQKENNTLINNLKLKNDKLNNLLQELRYQEEKFRSIFNTSSDPTFITDLNGLILEANPYGNKLLEDIDLFVKESRIMDLVDTKYKKEISKRIVNIKAENYSVVEVQLAGEHSHIYYELKAYPILFKDRNAIIITLRDITSRKQALKKEMQTIILTEEKERRRFAQELHDGIGPLLSTTRLYLQWLNKPNANLNKETIVLKMEETIEETFNSIQEISNNISPNTLNSFGLDAAVKKFIQRIQGISKIDFRYNNEIKNRLHNQLEITIYRILCELINNTLKYAAAKSIYISITGSQTINVKYQDDGKGFNVDYIFEKGKGFGLSNMKARVESLGGEYEIFSSHNQGTTVNIKLLKE